MADVTLSLTTEQITDLCEVLSHIVDETDFMVELHQRFKALQDKLEPFADPIEEYDDGRSHRDIEKEFGGYQDDFDPDADAGTNPALFISPSADPIYDEEDYAEDCARLDNARPTQGLAIRGGKLVITPLI